MSKKLVIVESPSKAKTIEKILGKNYEVHASFGHVVDLPKTKIGIDFENNFEPQYQTIKGKGDILKNLKKIAKKSDAVYLASDNDREGEAIAWHISNYINEPQKTKRIVFNEITASAIKDSVKHPHNIDMNKVDAQQARRILDRIVGYKISPLLWKIINKNASAGRVQSVALKIICDLEDVIKNFVPEKYWDFSVETKEKVNLRIAKVLDEKVDKIYKEEQRDLIKKTLSKGSLEIKSSKITKKIRKPPLVLKTSTLQQLASSYLGFSTSKSMRVAQQLYEGIKINNEQKGLITYMRTDSTRISNEAKDQAVKYITDNYGKEYIGNYTPSKEKNNIQDAHEGIRPTDVSMDPDKIKGYLNNDQYKLYKLIWERFLISQFANVEYDQLAIEIEKDDIVLRGTINKITFEGYYKIFKDEDEIETEDLPDLSKGDKLTISKLLEKEDFTKPPARLTESTLVKKLESDGIGRPSTYSSIIETLKKREYVIFENKKIIPTSLGYEVKEELEKHFKKIMNVKFTAEMEDNLDSVENGSTKWIDILSDFYKNLEKELQDFEGSIDEIKNRRIESDVLCANKKDKMIMKVGRFGKYLVCETNEEEKISLSGIDIPKEDIEKGKITVEKELAKKSKDKQGILTDVFTEDGKRYVLKTGRYGKYLESEDFKNDENRMSLDYSIKKKLENDQILEEDGILKLNSEVQMIKNIEQQIIDEAGPCEKCGKPFEIKVGRFGKFLACTGYPECKNIKKIPKKK